jgi:hypothetical protein
MEKNLKLARDIVIHILKASGSALAAGALFNIAAGFASQVFGGPTAQVASLREGTRETTGGVQPRNVANIGQAASRSV